MEVEKRLSEFSDELFMLWNSAFSQMREERLQSQRRPTLMGIFGVEDVELSHSNFISWLLDPEASHGLEAAFLGKFVEKIVEEKNTDLDGIHFENLHIKREKRGEEGIPDIIMNNDSFFCLIENKINSDEIKTTDEKGNVEYQTERYYREFKNKFNVNKKFFVYLTKPGVDGSRCEEFIHLTYHDIKDILTSLQTKASQPYDYVITEYIRNLEVNILSEFKGFDKKAQLYYKHLRDIEHVQEEFYNDIGNLFDSIYDIFLAEYDSGVWKGGGDNKSFWMAKRSWLNEKDDGVYYVVDLEVGNDRPIRLRLGSDKTNFREDFNEKFYNLPEIKNFTDNKIERIIKGKARHATLFREFLGLKFEDENYDEVIFEELKNFEKRFTKLVDKIIKKVLK